MTPRRSERRKLSLVLFGICAVFVCLCGRLYYIQALCHDAHAASVDAQTRVQVQLPARRGDILDRHGVRLAMSVPAYTVAASIPELRDRIATARKLAPILGLDGEQLARRLRRDVRFVFVKRKVPVDVARRIEEAQRQERSGGGPRHLAGIHLLPDSERVYTCGRTASHVLGFTRWQADRGDTGQEGIERALDGALCGTPGRWELKRDGRARTFAAADELVDIPVPGRQVRLTIDLAVQQALDEQLDALLSEYRPAAVFGLVLEPATGRILAMSSRPDFDPNRPGECEEGGRLNRLLTTVLEPGSTMKPLVAAVALEEGVFRADQKVFCENGSWAPRRGRTISDAHAYGWLTVSDAVIHSSNIGLAKIGREIGAPRLERYCRSWGFGQLSGLGLAGESRGIVHPLRVWTRDSVLSIPFGHEISVTPLQLAAAYSALANGGTLLRPQLVESIEDGEGRKLQSFAPAPVGSVISRKTSADVREMLRGAVVRGTGKRAMLKDWDVAGKTGTARKLVDGRYSETSHYSSFVAFAPVDRPRALALIVVDEPQGAHYGGTVAAPAVGALLGRTLAHLGVPRKSGGALARAADAASPQAGRALSAAGVAGRH